MTKRSLIRLFSFAVSFALVLAICAITNMNLASTYKAQLENTYQQSLNELSENLDLIETNLTKSIYSSSPEMLGEISKDLYSECSSAKDSLSRLPVEQMKLNSTYKFITQASDYASYLAQKAAKDKEIASEEHENLSTLLGYAEKLSSSVNNMASIANSGADIDTQDIKSEDVQISALSGSFTSSAEAFKDYPTLLYDGPFADAVLNKQSSLLEKADEIDREAARDIGAKAIGCNISELSFDGEEDGKIPCYVFSFSQKSVGITKKGGYVAYILYGGKITASSIDEDNAVKLAKSYLESIGYKNMTDTYYATSNNICVINFAYKTKGAIYYSDLIKVGVSTDSGKIVSLEAKGYLTNHTQRNGFDCKLSKAKAQACLSKYLSCESSKKCVIPKENGTEAECYEFKCKSSDTGEDVLIYINADTGAEEDIMLLLYSDNGTLTK